jgi:hypothetical protein
MEFFLGTHMPNWLTQLTCPLFISARRLRRSYTTRFPVSITKWCLDSAGFSELSLFGTWKTSPKQYAREVRIWSEEIGMMQWAAIQDWMCEPVMLAKTGLTIRQHQERTIQSYEDLMALDHKIKWLPVLQGFELDDYLFCLDEYARRGHDLRKLDCVGLGTVCRRQHTAAAEDIIRHLSGLGLKIHAFGFKTRGLMKTAGMLTSADSMAWSFDARRAPAMQGCTHRNCASCIRFARNWYGNLVSKLTGEWGIA